jgi:autotransporter-associated beta strand protein
VISGTGTLAKQGAGTLTLTGANTYTGRTIITAGTLRIGDGGTSGSIAGDVANDGVLAFNRSDAVTFAGKITGSGALVQMGNARLTLTGDHSYSGGTTVSAGGVQIGDGGTTGWIQGNVVANGILAFNRSDDVVFGGVVSGTGALHQLGTGKLTLTGANTVASGAMVAEGSTLQIGDGGVSGTFSGAIANTGELIFHRSDAIAYDGVISGTGTLTKRGAGVLTVSGTNTFTGLTRVDAGALMIASGSSVASAEVAAGAVLGGSGTIRGNLTNSGTVSPGFSPGVLPVTGNFVQHSGGKLVIEVASASSFDRLVVGGAATLDGTLEVVASNGFTFESGQTLEVISAESVSGRFAEIVSPFTSLPLAVRFDAIYGVDSVALAFVQVAYASFAITPNQAEVGGGLDRAVGSGEALTLRNEFNSYTDVTDIRVGLNELSPQRYERWFDAALFNTGALVRAVEDQIGGERAAGRQAWAEVVRREADFGGNVDVVAAELETSGIVAGVDHANDESIALGGLLSYETTRIDAASSGGRTRVETFTPALYARHAAGAWSSEAVVGHAWHDYDAVRTIALPGLPLVARGESEGTHRFASVRTSYALKAGQLAVTPFAGMQHVRWKADEFGETGAGDASLEVASQRGESLASRLGVRLALPFRAGGLWITPHVEGTWRHEFQQSRRHLTAAIGGSSFTVQGRAPSEDGWIASFGFDVRLRDTLSLYARLTRESDGAAERSTDLRAGANYRF